MEKKFLLVIQVERGNPGRLADKLKARGYELETCCPSLGDMLPRGMDGYAGAVVFGGPMSVNDDNTVPGLRTQLNWIPEAVESGRPFLGICLGAQLLARALGARVEPHPRGMAEIGYFPVEPTAAGADFLPQPLNVYHWHLEGFELPTDAVLLARGERFPHQAFRYRERAYGIQFHPEVTGEMMEEWMQRAAHRLVLPGAQPPEVQRAHRERCDRPFEDWLDGFLDRWLTEDE